MEIEVTPANRMKLSDFADKHGLKMTLVERSRTDLHPSIPYESHRWYAHFRNVDVKDGSVLIGVHGNGATGPQAMKDYAQQLSGKLLIVDAYTKESRREIYAPELL